MAREESFVRGDRGTESLPVLHRDVQQDLEGFVAPSSPQGP